MSQLSNFTQDEIEKLLSAPLLVGMFVMAASLSDTIGLMQEMMAAVETALETARQAPVGSLLNLLFSEDHLKQQEALLRQETREAMSAVLDFEQAREKMLEQIKTAVAILAAKGDASELAAYRQMLVRAAEKVAQAAREGGWFGLGSELVNARERDAIQKIRAAVHARA